MNKIGKVLVVGGAGYIGSHMVKYLSKKGCEVVTIDNLSHGHRDAVLFGKFIRGDLADRKFLENLFEHYDFSAVMHFASFIQVQESVHNPAKYYGNNVSNTLNLLDVMCEYNVKKLIFSSTAAIFGEPEYTPIDEKHIKRPISPYGKSKLFVESILEDYDNAYGLKSVSLRYFNAAGADPEGMLGERHEPETHLIPLILQAACGIRDEIQVYGRDYDTPDGTCIRDYVHVNDICEAHFLSLLSLMDGLSSQSYNLGNGIGFSVHEVVLAAEQVTQSPISVVDCPRRSGDPAILVADSRLIRCELSWMPKYPEIESIIRHAWSWHLR